MSEAGCCVFIDAYDVSQSHSPWLPGAFDSSSSGLISEGCLTCIVPFILPALCFSFIVLMTGWYSEMYMTFLKLQTN